MESITGKSSLIRAFRRLPHGFHFVVAIVVVGCASTQPGSTYPGASKCEEYEAVWRSRFPDPNHQVYTGVFAEIAQCYEKIGDRERALKYYKDAMAIWERGNPSDIALGRAYYDYAEFLDRMGQEDEAAAARKRWKELTDRFMNK
ncbi:MAG: tetratricopeptide repeat protein [Planctomycetota bacterium]|jgi:tetratricopeptide (TPR) repeat protein